MKGSGVILGLLVLVDRSGLFDGRPACPDISLAVPAGGSRSISIPVPTSVSANFFVQKYNTTTLSWQSVMLFSDGGLEKLLSSFKEALSFSGGYFKLENMSKGAEGDYMILDTLHMSCVAVVHVTMQMLEPSTAASGTSNSEKELLNETKGEEPGSLNLLVALLLAGVVVVVVVLLYKRGYLKSRRKMCAYPQCLSKMSHLSLTTATSQQTVNSQDSQESEEFALLVCDKYRDRAQGTRERNRDPENGEGDLLTWDRDLTQEPKEMDPLAGGTGPAQGTGGGLATLQDYPGVSRN